MYYIFLQDNNLNGAGECPQISENVKNIEVSENIFKSYTEDTDRYIWNGSEIISNPDYDSILNQRKIKEQKDKILEELDNLDKKRIRAVCENEIKNEKTQQTWLEYYNSQIVEYRKELEKLNK